MKNVVLELREDKACVLAKDGIVRIIENRNYQVGQVLELSEETLRALDAADRRSRTGKGRASRSSAAVRAMRIAASLLLLLGAGGTTVAYAAPFSTVTLDVNPSLAYELNAFDRVLALHSFNEDGEDIVEKVGGTVKGEKIEKAIALTLDALSADAYITEEETPAIVTVSSSVKDTEHVKKELMDGIEMWNEAQLSGSEDVPDEARGTIEPTAVVIDSRLRKEARDRQVSPGKLYMAEQLRDLLPEDQSESEEELIRQSVGELWEKLREYSGQPSSGETAPDTQQSPGTSTLDSPTEPGSPSGSSGSDRPSGSSDEGNASSTGSPSGTAGSPGTKAPAGADDSTGEGSSAGGEMSDPADTEPTGQQPGRAGNAPDAGTPSGTGGGSGAAPGGSSKDRAPSVDGDISGSAAPSGTGSAPADTGESPSAGTGAASGGQPSAASGSFGTSPQTGEAGDMPPAGQQPQEAPSGQPGGSEGVQE